MQPLAGDIFSEDEVRAALLAGQRELRFRYVLLDASNKPKKELDTIVDGTVTNDTFAKVKRTARFQLKGDDPDIDWLADRLQPYVGVRVQLPAQQEFMTDCSSLSGWRNSGLTVDATVGNPAPSWAGIMGRHAERDLNLQRGAVITCDVYLKAGTLSAIVINFFCDSSGFGQSFVLASGTAWPGSGFRRATSFTAGDTSTLTYPRVSAGTWHHVRIALGFSEAQAYVDDVAYGSWRFTRYGGWLGIGIAGLLGQGGYVDNIRVTAGEALSSWVEWPQGIFLLSSPKRRIDQAGSVTREVEAYDLNQVLLDDKVTERYTVAVGTNYMDAVAAVLESAGIMNYRLTPTDSVLPSTRDWKAGTDKWQIVSDLLQAANYRSLYFDENGVAVATPYRSPDERAVGWTYADDAISMLHPDAEDTLDLFNVPNRWVLVRSEPDLPILTSIYTNENPASPASTVRRGRVIVDFHDNVEAADQAALDGLARRIAQESSQVYRQIVFKTPIVPLHEDRDILLLTYSRFGLEQLKVEEVKWELPLRAGALMTHEVRRLAEV